MIALICFVLAVLASPFKSKSRLEALGGFTITSGFEFSVHTGSKCEMLTGSRCFLLRPQKRTLRPNRSRCVRQKDNFVRHDVTKKNSGAA